jgi:hypothetical protein
MLYFGTRAAVPNARNVPKLRNVLLTNITITRCPGVGRIIGLPEQPVTDFTLENATIQADQGILVQDADVVFKNVKFDIAVGQPITLDNAKVDQQP